MKRRDYAIGVSTHVFNKQRASDSKSTVNWLEYIAREQDKVIAKAQQKRHT